MPPGRGQDDWRDNVNPKSEARNTKHETNLNDINPNDKNKFRSITQSSAKRVDQFYALVSSFCFGRFENLDIRNWDLFRISKFEFRIYSSSVDSHRTGRTFSGLPLKAVV